MKNIFKELILKYLLRFESKVTKYWNKTYWKIAGREELINQHVGLLYCTQYIMSSTYDIHKRVSWVSLSTNQRTVATDRSVSGTHRNIYFATHEILSEIRNILECKHILEG